jgi:two-component system, chemotaxis family, protein-glutamate methylesterase/glutaminase
MPRDIVAVGASAGGVEALTELVKGLPVDLPAAVFITIHLPSNGRSVLPKILERAGPLPAFHPSNGDKIEGGKIYVAPPDHHLIVTDGHVALSAGPKENGHRPAIDVMFRSVARHCGENAVGVVLTGMLDDGVAGLLALKSRGAAVVVQDPRDALFSSMPTNAIKRVDVDRVVSMAEMAQTISDLANGQTNVGAIDMEQETRQSVNYEMALGDVVTRPVLSPEEVPGQLTMLTCPECHGSLWQLEEGDALRYLCHVGHAFSEDSFFSVKSGEVEAALWSALRAIQEHAHMLSQMAKRASERGHTHSGKQFEAQLAETERQLQVIRGVLLKGRASPTESVGR